MREQTVRWITGVLPEKTTLVLVSVIRESVLCTRIGYHNGHRWRVDGRWELTEDVRAWMPLPKPFAGDET